MASNENILGVRDRSLEIERDPTNPIVRYGIKRQAQKRIKRSVLSPGAEKRNLDRKAKKEKKAQVAAEAARCLVVGVDYGTTFSGVAYVSSTKTVKDVQVVTKWNGGQSSLLEKVPSKIAYASENENLVRDVWGQDVKPGMTACCWTKLLLDKSTKQSEYDDAHLYSSVGARLMHVPANKTEVEVVTDFLRFLYEHILKSLRREIGASALEDTPIKFELTLPATWGHAARDATRKAAVEAGFGGRRHDKITLIDEPEAAAISAMRSAIDCYNKVPFQPKTCTMIVDIGGGTADLVTYRIAKLHPNLELEEACVGQGAKVGGTCVDRNLHAFLQNRFGASFSELPLWKKGASSPFMNAFEEVKRNFTGTQNEKKCYSLPLRMTNVDPDNLNYDHDEDMVQISSEELAAMFELIFEKTFKLVKKQIRQTKAAKMPAVKTIVLCGGMGSSPYVEHRFEKFIQEALDGQVELVVPGRAWSAIARGAAIRGLEKSPVLFRRSRDNIGICVHEKFEAEKHDEGDAYTCPILGKRAKNQMRWLVKRGDKLRPNTKKFFDCYVVIDRIERTRPIMVYQDLYACTTNEPPNRMDDETVERVGRIEMDLTDFVGVTSKKIKRSGPAAAAGNIDPDIKIELSMGNDKGVLDAVAKIGSNPKPIGSTTISFVADPAWKHFIGRDD